MLDKIYLKSRNSVIRKSTIWAEIIRVKLEARHFRMSVAKVKGAEGYYLMDLAQNNCGIYCLALRCYPERNSLKMISKRTHYV